MQSVLSRLAALVLMASAAVAQTTGPRLQTVPEVPTPGAEVAVTYAPTDALGGADAVALRARLRTPDDLGYGWGAETRTLATLRPSADGTFRGRFTLPDSVVYAVLAVASASGDAVDANLRLGWPLRVAGPDGRPSVRAFEQESRDRTGIDSRGALRSAREFVRAHPDEPSSWYVLSYHEGLSGGSAAADSAATDHLARVRRFDRALADAPDADRAVALAAYAGGTDDAVASRWRDWVQANAPMHVEAVRVRVIDAIINNADDPVAGLDALDRLWAEAGPVHRDLVLHGLRMAAEVGDPARLTVWADRVDRVYPWQRGNTALTLVSVAATRAEGLRRLQAEIDRPLDPDRRYLLSTVPEHRADVADRAARLSGALGVALADAGDWAAALAPLALATETSWNARLLRYASRARLAASDTAGAARDLARLVADPALAALDADTTAAAGSRLVGEGPWAALLAGAQDDLRRRTLGQSVHEALPPVALADTAGAPVSLRATLAETGPTVVVLFSKGCHYCRQATPGVEALSERVAPLGARVEIVMDDPPVASSREFLVEDGYTGPVYHDPRAEFSAAVESNQTPTYYVFDRTGALRFESWDLDLLPRQLWALGVEGL